MITSFYKTDVSHNPPFINKRAIASADGTKTPLLTGSISGAFMLILQNTGALTVDFGLAGFTNKYWSILPNAILYLPYMGTHLYTVSKSAQTTLQVMVFYK